MGLAAIEKGVSDIAKSQKKLHGSVADMEKRAAEHGARLKAIEEHQASLGVQVAGIPGAGTGKFQKGYSIHDMMKRASGIGLNKPSKFEYPKEARERIMSAEVGSDGAFTVPVMHSPDIIERLKAMTVLDKVGIRNVELDDGAGTYTIARRTSGPNLVWVGEAEGAADSTPQFDLPVASRKTVSAVVEVPNALLKSNDASTEEILSEDFIEDSALAIDISGLRGPGTSNEPLGLINTGGIGSESAGTPDGGPFNIDLAIRLWKDVAAANSRMASLAYVTHPLVWGEFLRQTEGGQHVFPSVFFAPGVAENPAPRVMSSPVFTTTQLPIDNVEGGSSDLSEVIFGDWREFMMIRWGGLEIIASKEGTNPITGRSALTQDLTIFVVRQSVDVIIRHPAAFSLANDVETTS